MRKSFRFVIANLILVFSIALVSANVSVVYAAKPNRVIYVNDNAQPGGDGSLLHPVQTIQEGIQRLPKSGPGVVSVFPGTYMGPIPVTRADTVVQGRVKPLLDQDGYLAGFARLAEDTGEPESEVVITIDRLLRPGPAGEEPEDLFEVLADRVELHGVVLDSGGLYHNWFNAAFSAKAEGDEFYHDIVFSEIIVRGKTGDGWFEVPFDTSGMFRNADVLARYITVRSPGYTALQLNGNGQQNVEWADISSQEVGVTYIGQWESPSQDLPPARLLSSIRNSRIRDGERTYGIHQDTLGLWILGRGGVAFSNPNVHSSLVIEASGLTIEGVGVGIDVQAWGVPLPGGVAGGLFNVHASGNSFDCQVQDTRVGFRSLPQSGAQFVNDTTIIIHDGDGVFGAADTGPKELNNHYRLIQPGK